jgi:hypothetical protein
MMQNLRNREQCQVKSSNTFAGLECLDDDMDFKRAWKNKREKSKFQPKKIYVIELKQHKPSFNRECCKLLDKRNQAKWNV